MDVKIKLATEKRIKKKYKKEIYTDVIFNFSSMTPIKWKRSLKSCCLNRAKTISSSDAIYKEEITNLEEKFNSYPKKFVDKIIERFHMNNSNCHN